MRPKLRKQAIANNKQQTIIKLWPHKQQTLTNSLQLQFTASNHHRNKTINPSIAQQASDTEEFKR